MANNTLTPYKPPPGIKVTSYPTKLVINDKELEVVPMMMPSYVEIIRSRLIAQDKLEAALSEQGTTFIMVKQTKERQLIYYARYGHIYGEIWDFKTVKYKLMKIYLDRVAYVGRL